MSILGIDVSNHQGGINFAQVKASGHDFAVLKATEGIGFTDGAFARFRAQAHAAGLLVGIYHFARSGNAVAQADFFLSATGSLQVGEFVVLDDEDPAINPTWVKAWCDRIAARTGIKPLVYMNQSYRDSQNWSGVVADGDALWLAKYDGSTAVPPGGAWGSPAMKQYSSGGSVAGIAGPVDLDVFYGTTAQLLAYGYGGTTPNVLEGDDMPIFFSADQRGVAVIDGGVYVSLTGEQSVAWGQALGRAPVAMSTAAFDALRASVDGVNAQRVADTVIPQLLRAPAYDGGQQVSGVLAGLFQAVFQGGPSMPDGGQSIGQSLADLRGALGTVQAPAIDEAKLAAALLADPASIAALGKAIADNLQLTPRTPAS